MKSFLEPMGLLLLLITIITLFVLGIGVLIDQPSCMAKAAQMGHNASWSIQTGCMIEVREGKWFPIDSYLFDENNGTEK